MVKQQGIAFYIGDYTRSGGTERVCTAVVNGLAEKAELNVYLIATNNQKDIPFFEINPKVKIIHLNIFNPKKQYYALFSRFLKVLNKNSIDVLVSVEVMSLLFILPIYFAQKIKKQKVKLIVWEHFNFTVNLGKSLRDRCRKWAAKYADTIVVLTKRDVELWTDNLAIKGDILNINNPSPFPISTKAYNSNSKNIIAVGRLTYQKGFDRLLEIWAAFILQNNEDWKLQIIGDGPDKKTLELQAEKLGVINSVEMVGNTPNIHLYYENAAFLVMSSRFEGLPMTLIEAQSFGLPIIAYDCLTGPSEVISDSSGALVENGDKESFVKQLISFCNTNDIRPNMSAHAKKEVDKFSIDNVVRDWLSIIENGIDK